MNGSRITDSPLGAAVPLIIGLVSGHGALSVSSFSFTKIIFQTEVCAVKFTVYR